MDQESTASPNPSPAPAPGLNKATSYSKRVAGLVKEGSVAQRISQLQTQLSPPKPGPSAYPTSSSSLRNNPNRPTSEVSKECSLLKPLLVPLPPPSAPLPETPIRESHVTTNPTPQEELVNSRGALIRKLASVFDDQQQQKQDRMPKHAEEKPSIVKGKVGNATTKSKARQLAQDAQYTFNRQTAGSHSPLYALRTAGGSSTSSPQSAKSVISSRLGKSQKQSPPQMRLISSPEPTKRTMSPSSGSAYSRILPFTSSPSIPSYIPMRQSQKFGTDGMPSVRKLKSMTFTDRGHDDDDDEESTSQTATPLTTPRPPPPFFQSPRHQNTRYLRRKTFNTKSSDSLRRDSTIRSSDTTTTKASASTLEDVFVGPNQAAKTYRVEAPFVASDNAVVSTKNPHDIQSLNYTPSVMPRRFDYRSVLKSRHARSTTASSPRTPVLDNASLHGSPTPRTGVPLEQKDVVSRHVPTDDKGKASAEKPQQSSDEVNIPQPETTSDLDNALASADGARSRIETENDSDSIDDTIRGLFSPSKTLRSQPLQENSLPKESSSQSVHEDQAL